MKVIHLKIGWGSDGFERAIQANLDIYAKNGYEYYDIKISSSGLDTLLILRDTRPISRTLDEV